MKLKHLLLLTSIVFLQISFAYDVWNPKSNFGGVGRHRGTGIAIGTKGYIGLGHYNGAGPNIMLADWWEYDPSTNSWSQKANYPFPSYAATQFSIGSKAYVGTGVSAGNQFFAYDPIANSWTAIAPVPAGNTDCIGFAINGKGYYLNWGSFYEYDPITNAWTTKSAPPFSTSSWSSTFVINGKGYVKTGSSLYEYKPATDQWIYRAPFPGVATGGSACFAIRGKGYIVSGYIGWLSELTDEVWEFDPTTNSWALMEEFPANKRRFSASFAIGNKGYVGIGTNGTNFTDFWEFDEYLAIANEIADGISVFPNPSSNQVNFNIPENQNAQINNLTLKLYDISGRLVRNETLVTGNNVISTHELELGVYLYQILSEDEELRQGKLIFQ